MRVTRVFTVLAAIALLGVACGDDTTGIPSNVEIFQATLNGANEIPALPTATTATGFATLTVLGNVLSWQVEVENINNVNIGHIHFGAADASGGVMVNLSPTAGSYTAKTVIAEGSLVVNDSVLVHMRAGDAYVNIHTSDASLPGNNTPGDYPAGEIRGQTRKL
jgi:CHRD domain-containing protein